MASGSRTAILFLNNRLLCVPCSGIIGTANAGHIERLIYMNLNYALIGARIRRYREKNGLSQEELAALINISSRHLSKIETGIKNPSLSLVLNTANALHVSADELLADYLNGSATSLKTEFYTLFDNCTPTETEILMDMLKHMKTLLSEYGI